MSVSFNDIPLEIWAHKILPSIPFIRSFCAFACTATWASELIRNTARFIGDIDLAGKECSFICDANTLAKACILQIFKVRVLNIHPELFSYLSDARAAFEGLRNEYPNLDSLPLLDSLHLYGWHANRNTCGRSSENSTQVFSAILPFDLQTNKLGPSRVGEVLIYALECNNTDLAQLALAHPASKNIEGENDECFADQNDLGIALRTAVSINSSSLAREILLLPNAKDIGADRLGNVLVQAIKQNSLELTKLVLAQPHAEAIHPWLLSEALDSAIIVQNPKLALKVVSHPNAINMKVDNSDCFWAWTLESCLKKAIALKHPKLIETVLHHPKIVKLKEKDLYKAGIAMLSEEDLEPLLDLQEMLETDHFKLPELGKIFINLTPRTQYFFYLMLCKMRGSTALGIEKQGMIHFVKRPESLLTIINNLEKNLKSS
jgi:hypothetical protein